MPPEGLQPVEYDPAAFEEAVTEVDAALVRLHEAAADRHARTVTQLDGWAGLARRRFDGWGPTLVATHLDVIGRLQTLRGVLAATREAIEAENRRRAALLEDWWWQQRRLDPVP